MTLKNKISVLFLSTIMTGATLTGCLEDSKQAETIITNWQNATVKSFSMKDNSTVCSGLSKYAFTIDNFGTSDPALSSTKANSGIIFNPDSLPVGSVPDSITVEITMNNASKVVFYQYDKTGALKKTTNFKDTQWVFFNDYAVTRLDVTSYDESFTKSYFIKVNVHKVNGDTICWQYLAKDALGTVPPADQKTIEFNGYLFWFTENADGTQNVSCSTFGKFGEWETPTCPDLKDGLVLSSIIKFGEKLFAVGKDGSLLSTDSPMGVWDVCNEQNFVALLGVQPAAKKNEEFIHAIVKVDGELHFATSTSGTDWEVGEVIPEGFPVMNFSNPISDEARPSTGNVTSRVYIVGGETADGTITSSTWSCDGNSWAEFTQSYMPAMTRAAIIQYTLDADHPKSFWILWPGVLADGSVCNTPYFSENKGVTWKLMEKEYATFTETTPIAPVGGVSPVMDESNYWMYFFGGVDSEGVQQGNVFGGQLVRLTFDKKK